MRNILGFTLATLLVASFGIAQIRPVEYKVADKINDVLLAPEPMDVQLAGYLGARVAASEKSRLLVVDEEELLAGFRKRPGKQDWIGEHVGKFLHAATLAWANTGDKELRVKIDRVVVELIKCQDPDGYLGTYVPAKHWTSWDVWVHKYNLIGLLTYHRYTGDAAALECSKKMADLLLATFPSKMSIIKAGTHVGMAATSVLEPIVMLYKLTGEQKYLDFAKYIVAAYDEPNGPKVIKSLVELKAVNKTANGKAYEMLSNLVGLCDLARVTGDRSYLVPVGNAWDDIVKNQLYITGAMSHGEHFGKDHDLPNVPRANVGETCVTTTWIQLNLQLLRLTGETKYADELERAYYNHLAAAQLPDGSKWCYYTALVGAKPYGKSTNCCLSSGPRAMALAPQAVLLARAGGLVINSLDSFTGAATVQGTIVRIEVVSEYPRQGRLAIVVKPAKPVTFPIQVRCPSWAKPMQPTQRGQTPGEGDDGYLTMPAREWKDGDKIEIAFNLSPRLIKGTHTNEGYAALAYGPFILAYDVAKNPTLPNPSTLALVEGENGAPLTVKQIPGDTLAFEAAVRTAEGAAPVRAVFVPFAEAGASGSKYQVWMSTTNRPATTSLLAPGTESRSRPGNLEASINDGDPGTFVVTFDAKKAAEDFFAVTLDKPVTIGKVLFAHGKSFHDGGWFDASAGKPRFEIQKTKSGPWESLATLDSYPATTANDSKRLKEGQEFTLKLPAPVEIVGLRIVGKPACGDNPAQAFSSCGELQGLKE